MVSDAKDKRIVILANAIGIGMLLALLFTLLMGHYGKRSYPYNTFLLTPEDRFMDFFNINEFVHNWEPYVLPKLATYPPLGLLLSRAFAVGFEYTRLGPLAARNDVRGLISYSLFVALFLAFYFGVIYRGIRTSGGSRDLKLAFILGCNFPLLFLLDRGNYLMACWMCLFGFVHYYRTRPNLANLCLVLAISLKLHPALFLLLPLGDRRWRDAIAVVGLTLVLNLAAMTLMRAPFLDNVGQFLYNVLSFSDGYHDFIQDSAMNLSFSNLLRVPFGVFAPGSTPTLKYGKAALALAVLVGLVWLMRSKAPYWKKVFALCIAEVGFQPYSPSYNLLLLVIPVLLYLNEAGPLRRGEWLVLGSVILLFVPKVYGVLRVRADYPYNTLTIQDMLNPLLLLLLFGWLVVSTWRAERMYEDQPLARSRSILDRLRRRRLAVEQKAGSCLHGTAG